MWLQAHAAGTVGRAPVGGTSRGCADPLRRQDAVDRGDRCRARVGPVTDGVGDGTHDGGRIAVLHQGHVGAGAQRTHSGLRLRESETRADRTHRQRVGDDERVRPRLLSQVVQSVRRQTRRRRARLGQAGHDQMAHHHDRHAVGEGRPERHQVVFLEVRQLRRRGQPDVRVVGVSVPGPVLRRRDDVCCAHAALPGVDVARDPRRVRRERAMLRGDEVTRDQQIGHRCEIHVDTDRMHLPSVPTGYRLHPRRRAVRAHPLGRRQPVDDRAESLHEPTLLVRGDEGRDLLRSTDRRESPAEI